MVQDAPPLACGRLLSSLHPGCIPASGNKSCQNVYKTLDSWKVTPGTIPSRGCEGQGQGYTSWDWGKIQWEKAPMGGWVGGGGVLAVCQRPACIHTECMRYTFMHIYTCICFRRSSAAASEPEAVAVAPHRWRVHRWRAPPAAAAGPPQLFPMRRTHWLMAVSQAGMADAY